MNFGRLALSAVGLLSVSLSAAPKQAVSFPDGARLRSRFGELSGAAQTNRTVDSAGGRRAFEWLSAQARKIPGWSVRIQEFVPDVHFALMGYDAAFVPFKSLDPKLGSYIIHKRELDGFSEFARHLEGKRLSNIVLHKDGTNPALANRPIVVSAHFDTIVWRKDPFELFPDLKTEGADDNGAAVVALLAMAESLKDLKPRRPVELVLTDAAEAFFLGAHAYAEALSAGGAQADAIVLEMIGHDAPARNHLRLYTRSESQPGIQGDDLIAVALHKRLAAGGLQADITRSNAERAENHAFRRAIHSNVLVGVDWEYGFDDAHYHSVRDTADAVDWDFAAKVGKAVTEAVAGLAK